ncbi:vps13a, partial [Symbiodinium sp. KB8]
MQVLVGALGDYVDGISASEIDLSLMGGTVDLHDLRVKEEALDGMEVPFRVKRGVIGHVRLFVPSYNPYELKKQPLDLHLEDVYLLVGKATQTPEEIERRRQTAEASALTSADLTRTRIAGEELAPKTDEGDTATLVGAIVNNIRISVSRVHLRFEDSTSHANHPFAVGLTFSSFTTENARGAAAVFKSGE